MDFEEKIRWGVYFIFALWTSYYIVLEFKHSPYTEEFMFGLLMLLGARFYNKIKQFMRP